MNRKDAYRIAIEAEIRSQNLYKALAKSFNNAETAQFYNQLVQYETDHEQKVRGLYAKEFPGQKLELIGNLDMQMEGLKLDDPKAVLEFAISREELAQNIYLKLAEQSEDADTKALLEQLAREEELHKELLFAEIEKLHGILQWYDSSELDGFMEH
ncbi:MAG: ferritin family protein [Candidatus Cloacimonadaceae bacterium]|jgi:rubrerythrin|nr:ferritin family protein [Candidatus Cloacimonadota bacterium]MDY0128111.1 ferritin family protein [Candidatus Cloacimonadaceae bacterium]MCB5255624.1 ferritin family protein [Candidatus Cloacimonadota bacterium]MCK9178401.1 ferritin family protein [Candidatus Cloacimonadota bacterium]MCK9242680.1 ferritin family protein [Candidatus Cloacimonadota bacterium]